MRRAPVPPVDTGALSAAVSGLDAPLVALDLAALHANATSLIDRAGGTRLRIASKSVRCRWALTQALSRPGVAGVMAYSLREAIWLVRSGLTDDVLVGYPSVDRSALATLGADNDLLSAITVMVDDVAQLDLIRSSTGAPVRVCLDVDASWRPFGLARVHLGVRRSPLRSPAQAAKLAAAATGLRVVGVMFYEAQIAGLPDTSAAVRVVKRRSAAELATRRRAVADAVREVVGPLPIVNSGGTGSLEISAADPVVTEVTAGSGLYGPTLFDGYRAFAPRPALLFALPVVRRPAPGIATVYGGGYIASGPAGASRVPSPAGAGLRLIGTEGAGEVQTPVRGRCVPSIGDLVWFRHAKAGELLERFDSVHVVENGRVTSTVPTYRGDGQSFG